MSSSGSDGGQGSFASASSPPAAGAPGAFPGYGGAGQDVGAAAAGTSVLVAHEDHAHRGVVTVQTLTGAVTLQVSAAKLALATNGQTIVIGGSGNAVADAANWLTRLAWFVDPSNSTGLASDSNTGADSSHPLLTMAELSGRVWGNQYVAGSPCFTTLMSDMLAGQSAYFNVFGIGAVGGTLAMPLFNCFFNIVGSPTVIYTGTGTVASPSQVGNNAVGDNHFTDGAAPAFATANRLWKRTNGTVAYFWPLKDLTGGVWRVSQPSSGSNQATLTAGDSWQILQLPVLRNIGFPASADRSQYGIALCNEASTSLVNRMSTRISWQVCQFTSTSPVLMGTDLYNCADMQGHFASVTGGFSGETVIRGGAIRADLNLPAAGVFGLAASGNLYTSFQAARLIFDQGTQVVEANLAFYDCTSTLIDLTKSNARCFINNCGGSGNSSRIMQVRGAGAVAVVNSVAAPPGGITSDGTPYQVKAATAASPPIVDTTVLSEVVADV